MCIHALDMLIESENVRQYSELIVVVKCVKNAQKCHKKPILFGNKYKLAINPLADTKDERLCRIN